VSAVLTLFAVLRTLGSVGFSPTFQVHEEYEVSQTVEHRDHCKHGHSRHEKHEHHHHHHEVSIIFNGVSKEFTFRPEESVRTLLDKALREFHVANNPHTYGLFAPAGAELKDNETLQTAGVHCSEMLLLRASTVRAGHD
jgi:hypothetical protein